MKGKKFDAAEKHFAKRRAQYETRIKTLQTTNNELSASIVTLIVTNQELQTQIAELDVCCARLLAYTDLTPEELNELIESEKARAKLYSTLNALASISAGFIRY